MRILVARVNFPFLFPVVLAIVFLAKLEYNLKIMHLTSRLNPQDTEAIEATIESFVSTWNNKNPEAFGTLFTEDAEFTDVIGQTAIGKEAIIRQHVFPIESVMKKATLEMKDAYARAISDTFAVVSALWKVEGSMTPDQRPLPTRHGVVQIILERNGDGFLIKLVHNSDNALPYERQDQFIEPMKPNMD